MFDSFRQRFHQWRLYRQATTQLYELDDHLLADMGIERQQIRQLVRRAATTGCSD